MLDGSIIGALVQLIRIHVCRTWGHEFESRTHRKITSQGGAVVAHGFHIPRDQWFESTLCTNNSDIKLV